MSAQRIEMIENESESRSMNSGAAKPQLTEAELVQAGYRYALSIVRHKEDAEDLVQQGWLKLMRAYGKVEGTPVLFRTIRNLFYDQKRRNKIVQFEALDSTPEPGKSESISGTMDMEVVLDQLRPEERESIFLNVVEGYTASEISTRTGTPRGTILSHIHRARQKLAKAFGSEFRDGSK